MTASVTSYEAATILVWMPKGKKPGQKLDPTVEQEHYWSLREAVSFVMTTQDAMRKRSQMDPWIESFADTAPIHPEI